MISDIRSGELGRDLMKSFNCQEDAAIVEGWSMQRCQLDLITMIRLSLVRLILELKDVVRHE
jgi:hypothetical protein